MIALLLKHFTYLMLNSIILVIISKDTVEGDMANTSNGYNSLFFYNRSHISQRNNLCVFNQTKHENLFI